MPHSASLQDWVEVVAAPLPDHRKGKQRAIVNGTTDEEEAAASLVKDTDRIRLAYDSRGRRMVNQSVFIHISRRRAVLIIGHASKTQIRQTQRDR
jgi:hypothetical protein